MVKTHGTVSVPEESQNQGVDQATDPVAVLTFGYNDLQECDVVC